MPLQILLPLVVLGIAGIALMLHLLGYSRQAVIGDACHAMRLWRHHWPQDHVTSALVAPDGHAALVETANGPGLVWALGADTTARLLAGAEISPCGTGLQIRLHDFSAPHVTVHLPPGEARAWQARIVRPHHERHAP